MDKIYVGDSVYAERDGFGIILTTENGMPDDPGNRIVLEPETWDKLISWVHEPQPEPDKLIAFEDIPLGCRFRYPGHSAIWTVIRKFREVDGGPMHGVIAEWESGIIETKPGPLQSLCSHIPTEADCPEMVIGID